MIAHDDRLAKPTPTHPDLVRVLVEAARTCPIPIMVVGGARSIQDAYVNFGKGRTAAQCLAGGCPASFALPKLSRVTFLRRANGSKHIQQSDGYGHAIDLSPVPYAPTVTPAYTVIAQHMKAAAKKLGIGIAWGGDWKTTKDYPHFELTGDAYV